MSRSSLIPAIHPTNYEGAFASFGSGDKLGSAGRPGRTLASNPRAGRGQANPRSVAGTRGRANRLLNRAQGIATPAEMRKIRAVAKAAAPGKKLTKKQHADLSAQLNQVSKNFVNI